MAPASICPNGWVKPALLVTAIMVLTIVATAVDFTSAGTTSKVRVAIIDGGVDPNYPALNAANIDVRTIPGTPSRVSEHGSAMAAILVESAQSVTVARAPNIEILDIPALDASGVGEVESLTDGIETAAQQDVDVIVAALGVEMDTPELKEAVSQAQENGVFILAAAGNGIGSFTLYPAEYEEVISVGAVNKNGDRLRFTNTRASDLLAPGDNIRVESRGGGFQPYSGTSPATAIAAGKIVGCWPLIAPRNFDRSRRNTPVDQAIERSIEAQGKDPQECKSL